MKTWIRNNWKIALLHLFVIVGLAICCYRGAHANPCDPPQGWTGEVVGDTPAGPVVVTTDVLYFAAYNDQVYIFSFSPDAHRLVTPFDETVLTLDPSTCTYHVDYEDDIFRNDLEEDIDAEQGAGSL